jgi:kinesin family member 5
MVEIYLKKVRDLLDLSKDNLQIKERKIQGIYISGAIEIFIFNSSDVLENLFPGIDNGVVGKTHMNLDSSRNHCLCIFSVQYGSTSYEREPSRKIIIIDLDGSEKVETTDAEGRGLDEAKTINSVIDSLNFVSVSVF